MPQTSYTLVSANGSGIYHSVPLGCVGIFHFLLKEGVTRVDAFNEGYIPARITEIIDRNIAIKGYGEE